MKKVGLGTWFTELCCFVLQQFETIFFINTAIIQDGLFSPSALILMILITLRVKTNRPSMGSVWLATPVAPMF